MIFRSASLVSAALWLAAAASASAQQPRPAPQPALPEIRVQMAPIPAPTTVAALLEIYRASSDGSALPRVLPRCQLPDVIPAEDWITLAGPDAGLSVRLPVGWRARAPGDSAFGEPETVLEDAAGGRIRMRRVRTGSEGRESLNTSAPQSPRGIAELPHSGPCQVGDGPAGSIWTLYPADPGATTGFRSRHIALGDLITAGGLRYKVNVSAGAAEALDRLVRLVADAALATAARSVPGGE